MNKYIGLIVLGLAMWSCAPKVTKTTSSDNYYEDLSSYRPELSTEEEPADKKDNSDQETTSNDAFVAPTHDITNDLQSLLDKIANDNRNDRVTYYSIQVYTGISREDANRARQRVYGVLSDASPRLEYNQPNYKVKVGLYYDRLEAHKTFTKLQRAFPTALLVPERRYLN